MAVLVAVFAAGPRLDAAEPVTPDEADRLIDERIGEARDALTADPGDRDRRLTLARLLHYRGGRGDDGSAKRALEMFDALAAEFPGDPRIAAYLGSATMLRAKRAWLPWKKGELVQEGGAMINDALERAQSTPERDEVEVRLLRAVSAAQLPEWMDQRAVVSSDLAALEPIVEAAAHEGLITPGQAATALLYRGRDLALRGETEAAASLYRRAIEAAPESHAAIEAVEALKDSE